MDKVSGAIWNELDAKPEAEARHLESPEFSSLRRSLQREHLSRLIDLSMLADGNTAQDTIKTLASMQLKDIKRRIDGALENGKLDTTRQPI